MNSYRNNVKLKVNNLVKNYGDLLVVNDVSIYLREREFLSLIGPSGCGKSTIFNMIAGIVKPDKGEIIIDGEDYTNKTGRVSYMYQKDLLLPWKKIIDNVSIPLVVKGVNKKEARERVKQYFKDFGLEGFEYKYPYQLSGGMRQRAALLRTYMSSQDIILLDEPFGGLDAITKRKMQYWLLDVLDKLKASVLFITHDIEEALLLSDRIYILSQRPATIKGEMAVSIPKPRSRDVVTSVEFNRLKKEIIEIMDN